MSGKSAYRAKGLRGNEPTATTQNPLTQTQTPSAITATTAVVTSAGIAGAAGAGTVAGAVCNAVGFGAAGIKAGSLAAASMGPATAAGSLTAAMQSVGATGTLAYLGAGATVAVTGAVAVTAAVAAFGVVSAVRLLTANRTQQLVVGKDSGASSDSEDVLFLRVELWKDDVDARRPTNADFAADVPRELGIPADQYLWSVVEVRRVTVTFTAKTKAATTLRQLAKTKLVIGTVSYTVLECTLQATPT